MATLIWIYAFCLTLAAASRGHRHHCPHSCECYTDRRGITTFNCTDLNSASGPFATVPEAVILSTRHAAKPEVFVHLKTAKYLNMANASLTNLPKDTFYALEEVQEIDLSYNLIKHINEGVFKTLKKLHVLSLRGNPLVTVRLVSNSIRELDLGNCGLHKLFKESLSGLRKLSALYLDGNYLRTLSYGSLPPTLKHVNLSRNKITNVPINLLLTQSSLTSINLSHNPINCTCHLMLLQDWFARKKVSIEGGIRCSYPRKYAGQWLSYINENENCAMDAPHQILKHHKRHHVHKSLNSLTYAFNDDVNVQADQPMQNDAEKIFSNEETRAMGDHMETMNAKADDHEATTEQNVSENDESNEGREVEDEVHNDSSSSHKNTIELFQDRNETANPEPVEKDDSGEAAYTLTSADTSALSDYSLERFTTESDMWVITKNAKGDSGEETVYTDVDYFTDSDHKKTHESLVTTPMTPTSESPLDGGDENDFITTSVNGTEFEEENDGSGDGENETELSQYREDSEATTEPTWDIASTDAYSSSTTKIPFMEDLDESGRSIEEEDEGVESGSGFPESTTMEEDTTVTDIPSTTDTSSSKDDIHLVPLESSSSTSDPLTKVSEAYETTSPLPSTEGVIPLPSSTVGTIEVEEEKTEVSHADIQVPETGVQEGFSGDTTTEPPEKDVYKSIGSYVVVGLIVLLVGGLLLVAICKQMRPSQKVRLPVDAESNMGTEMQDMLLPKPPENGVSIVPYTNGNTRPNGTGPEHKEEEEEPTEETPLETTKPKEDQPEPVQRATARLSMLAGPQTPVFVHK